MGREIDSIHGVTVSARAKLHDERGWFMPSMTDADPATLWLLQNISLSKPGTLRGLHYQDPFPQHKFLVVIQGSIQDIVADLRPESPTYKRFSVHHLQADGVNQISVPSGCAHGFLVTGSEPAMVAYLADAPYRPSAEKTVFWNDPAWGFPWLHADPVLSTRDRGESNSSSPRD